MVRRVSALCLALLLPASLLAAPFHHVHESGHARQHVAKYHSGSLALHLHFAGRYGLHHGWTPDIESSARTLSLFRGELTASAEFAVVILSETAVLDPVLMPQGWVRDSDYRIHDPPRIDTRSPRAPPV